ncbi:MAG: S1 RNA-binding domain-containing protein [Candidatus Nanohaloarchaea archaeon]|nr:S1 RNA-binding domain-containing protein [Candidatus Nanohaloarchaea archaeon]
MRSYKDRPDEGSLVVIEVEEINPHSVYAQLEEYPGVNGLIHISEISRSWVRDIRKHLDEGEKTVALVLEEDDDDSDSVNLSLKRVNDNQKREKMQEWNKEKKADKFIEKVADRAGEDFDEVYENVAFPLQQEFGNTFDGFEEAVVDQEAIEDVIDDRYRDDVIDVAKDNISLKQVKLEGELDIEVPTGHGLATIKEAIKAGDGVEVDYISAPKYKIKVWGRNQQQAKKRMDKAVNSIRGQIEDAGGTFDFERA